MPTESNPSTKRKKIEKDKETTATKGTKAKTRKSTKKRTKTKTSKTESSASSKKTEGKKQTFKLKGYELLGKVKELINQGNIRRIIIKDKKDKVIAEFPLTVGVVGVALVPILAAIGTIAALVTDCSIDVEKK